MLHKVRISLLSAAAVCLAIPAHAAVSPGLSMPPSDGPAGTAARPALEIAYHDMRHVLPTERNGDRWSFQRRELRIDRSLNCFLAGSGDLICFTAAREERKAPARDISRDEKLTPAGSR